MNLFQLSEITTKDRLVHQGLFFKPQKHGDTAILYMHGLTGRFYGDKEIIEALATQCQKNSWGLASFNNRGHDLVVNIRKLEKNGTYSHVHAGSSYEHFKDCVYDIKAGVDFLEKQEFTKIILVGISTGANKACYYGGTQKDKRIKAIILASPLCDRLSKYKNQEEIKQKLIAMKQLVKKGKGEELQLDYYFPITPKRYLSLHQSSSNEDCFDYGDPQPKLKLFSRIKIPVMVVFGGQDEYADRPVKKILAVFDKKTTTQHYNSVIIPETGHVFVDKEKEFASQIAHFGTRLN